MRFFERHFVNNGISAGGVRNVSGLNVFSVKGRVEPENSLIRKAFVYTARKCQRLFYSSSHYPILAADTVYSEEVILEFTKHVVSWNTALNEE